VTPVPLPNLAGYSRALYSNWLWHQPLRIVVDAGEGLPLALGSQVFAVDVVAITHGHSDHVLGLPGFAGARRFGKGAQEKPYVVIHPAGASGVAAIAEMIASLWRGVDFPIQWVALADGDTHRLDARRAVQAFAVTHVPGEPAFGYRILETRHRLKPEHAGRPQAEIEEIARRQGRSTVMEDFSHVVFAHSGDAMPVPVEAVRGADLLVHDATFLEPGDRRAPIHASSREVFELAREAAVRTLVLNHLSIRYERQMALARLREQLDASGFAGECWLLDEGTFTNLR
jgi:ribonuclease Z